MLDKMLQWDTDSLIYLNNLGTVAYDDFWVFVTTITNWIPLFLLFVFLFFFSDSKQEATKKVICVVALVVFITVLTQLVKLGFQRLRPNNESSLLGLIRILKSPTDYSFFSGHAASSCSITLLVVMLLKKKFSWVWLFFIWTCRMAL